MAQPEGTHRKVELERLLADAMAQAGVSASVGSLAEAALDRLSAPDVIDEMYSAIGEAIEWAFKAWSLDEDTYAQPSHKTLARVGANAVRATLRGSITPDVEQLSLEDAQALLDNVDYKGWRFTAQPLPDGSIGVAVRATVENAHHADKDFTTTRTVPVRGSVLASAFDAVLVVERHEARERFKLAGKLAFDPHGDDFDPAGVLVLASESPDTSDRQVAS